MDGWMLTLLKTLLASYSSNYECLAGILEIRTVSEGGILAIKGVKSQHYICMSKAGQLQGKVVVCFLTVHSDSTVY